MSVQQAPLSHTEILDHLCRPVLPSLLSILYSAAALDLLAMNARFSLHSNLQASRNPSSRPIEYCLNQ